MGEDDEGRHHDYGHAQHHGGDDVDGGPQLDEHQQGRGGRGQGGGQEGLSVEGHALGAVGQQGGGGAAADVGGARGPQTQQMGQGEPAQMSLLAQRAGAGDPLGEQLAGGTQDGRGQRLGERARNRRGAQERTQGTSGGDEAPARSQGAQQRQTEGDSPRTASRRRGDRGAGREAAAQWRRNGHGGSA